MPIVKSFILGIIAAFFALVAETIFSIVLQGHIQTYFFSDLNTVLLVSIAIEEIAKYAIIYKNSFFNKKKSEIIASGLLVGAGFAATEITMHVYGQLNILKTSSLFFLGALFVHVFTATFDGYLIAKKENVYYTTTRALIVNIFVHLLYNAAVIYFF